MYYELCGDVGAPDELYRFLHLFFHYVFKFIFKFWKIIAVIHYLPLKRIKSTHAASAKSDPLSPRVTLSSLCFPLAHSSACFFRSRKKAARCDRCSRYPPIGPESVTRMLTNYRAQFHNARRAKKKERARIIRAWHRSIISYETL